MRRYSIYEKWVVRSFVSLRAGYWHLLAQKRPSRFRRCRGNGGLSVSGLKQKVLRGMSEAMRQVSVPSDHRPVTAMLDNDNDSQPLAYDEALNLAEDSVAHSVRPPGINPEIISRSLLQAVDPDTETRRRVVRIQSDGG